MTDEYALLLSFVTHAESGEADYKLGVDVSHIEQNGEIYRTCCAVYVGSQCVCLVDLKEISLGTISPSRLKPFEDNFLRHKYHVEFDEE